MCLITTQSCLLSGVGQQSRCFFGPQRTLSFAKSRGRPPNVRVGLGLFHVTPRNFCVIATCFSHTYTLSGSALCANRCDSDFAIIRLCTPYHSCAEATPRSLGLPCIIPGPTSKGMCSITIICQSAHCVLWSLTSQSPTKDCTINLLCILCITHDFIAQ